MPRVLFSTETIGGRVVTLFVGQSGHQDDQGPRLYRTTGGGETLWSASEEDARRAHKSLVACLSGEGLELVEEGAGRDRVPSCG